MTNDDTKTVDRPYNPDKDPGAKSGTDQYPRVEKGISRDAIIMLLLFAIIPFVFGMIGGVFIYDWGLQVSLKISSIFNI